MKRSIFWDTTPFVCRESTDVPKELPALPSSELKGTPSKKPAGSKKILRNVG
jgi:hypothetical protein